MPTHFAITMAPLDWGISIAALLMLLFSARMLVSGKGKSQMGLSFAVMAAVIWTFAIGRHIEGFTTVDGLRVAGGALLMVPVLRALFSQTGASITGAVISVVGAAWLAGPVIARYSPNVVVTPASATEQLQTKLESIEAQIKSLSSTQDSVAGFASIERTKLADFNVSTEAELQDKPEAMQALKRWAGYKAQLNSLSRQIGDLRNQETEVSSMLRAFERGGGDAEALVNAEKIKEAVEREAGREDKTLLEEYDDHGKLIELFENEFSETAEPKQPD